MEIAGLVARAGGAVVVTMVVGGCAAGRESEPTVPPAPVLTIVTVTPGVPPTPTVAVAQRYMVQEGDTLSGIADRFGVGVDELMAANRLSDRDVLLAGRELLIPAPQP